MVKIKVFLGYLLAFLSIIIGPALISSNYFIARTIVKKADLVISPYYDGGKIAKTIDHQYYKTVIHEVVFIGLFSRIKRCFVQIDWIEGIKFPEVITENIDFDNDGKTDFIIKYDTLNNKAEIKTYTSTVFPKVKTYRLRSYYMARIFLTNPDYQ